MEKVPTLIEYNWNQCLTIVVRYYLVIIRTFILFVPFLLLLYYLLVFRRPHVALPDSSMLYESPFKPSSKSSLLHINGTIHHMSHFQEIYIINIPSRSNRRTRMIALMQALGLDAYIVPAHTTHSPQVTSRIHLVHNGIITLVELACWASHMQIWSTIMNYANDNIWILVLEDDIDLEADTLAVLDSFPEELWRKPDLIYLGSCGNIPGTLLYEGINGYRVHRALNPSCTHAYAIRPSTARKLQRLLSAPRKAVDDEIVILTNNEKLSVLSIHPPLAIQAPITLSNPSDVNPRTAVWKFKVKLWINSVLGWWRGVEVVSELRNSTLAKVDLNKALQWRKNNEKMVRQYAEGNIFDNFYS